MTTRALEKKSSKKTIAPDDALRIARRDAEKAYGDLSAYRIAIRLGDEGWSVDYELPDALTAGGGPHYVIEQTTGAIRSKRYEQ